MHLVLLPSRGPDKRANGKKSLSGDGEEVASRVGGSDVHLHHLVRCDASTCRHNDYVIKIEIFESVWYMEVNGAIMMGSLSSRLDIIRLLDCAKQEVNAFRLVHIEGKGFDAEH